MIKSVYHTSLVKVIFLAGSFLFTQKIFSQPPAVKASVDKTNILIGEQFHYRVSTSMPDNTYRLTWFTLPDTLGKFKIIKLSKIDSTTPNGNLNFSQTISCTSFDSGKQVIPPLILNFETLEGDSSFNILTDSFLIHVDYAEMDSVKTFHDIKSIIQVKKQWEWWWWTLLAVALIVLFFWVRFLNKFFRKKNAPELFKSKLLPYDEAMQSLTNLDAEQLLQKDEVKQYHTRLTEILKRYISRKSKVYKMHLTSDELLMELDSYNLSKVDVTAFANCLRMSNAVKFAKYIPPQIESEKCLKQTKNMITEIHTMLNKKIASDS